MEQTDKQQDLLVAEQCGIINCFSGGNNGNKIETIHLALPVLALNAYSFFKSVIRQYFISLDFWLATTCKIKIKVSPRLIEVETGAWHFFYFISILCYSPV